MARTADDRGVPLPERATTRAERRRRRVYGAERAGGRRDEQRAALLRDDDALEGRRAARGRPEGGRGCCECENRDEPLFHRTDSSLLGIPGARQGPVSYLRGVPARKLAVPSGIRPGRAPARRARGGAGRGAPRARAAPRAGAPRPPARPRGRARRRARRPGGARGSRRRAAPRAGRRGRPQLSAPAAMTTRSRYHHSSSSSAASSSSRSAPRCDAPDALLGLAAGQLEHGDRAPPPAPSPRAPRSPIPARSVCAPSPASNAGSR